MLADILEKKFSTILGRDYARDFSKIVNLSESAIFHDDFWGGETFTTAGQGSPWAVADTSVAGAPTVALVTPSATGEIKMTLAADNEVENLCLSFGNSLCFDIDNVNSFEARVKIAAMLTGSELVFGLGSARHDTTDSVTNNAWFKMVGATSTTLVVAETDDGTTDLDDKATSATLASTYKKFTIDLSDKSNVKFYVDGVRVASATTFDMSAATGSLQPIFQLQKAANTNVTSITIDYVKVVCDR
jgi:hypothetical protein